MATIKDVTELLNKLGKLDELENLRKKPNLFKNASYRAFKINQLRELQVKLLEDEIRLS